MKYSYCILFISVFFALLLGCSMGLRHGISHKEHLENRDEPVPVQLVIGKNQDTVRNTVRRTIAPSHLDLNTLKGNYSLRVAGNSSAGDSISIADWTSGILLLHTGVWKIEVEAVDKNTNHVPLRGVVTIDVDGPTSVPLTLYPTGSGQGSVRVQFTIPDFVLRRLGTSAEPTTGSKSITIGLFDMAGNKIPNTEQVEQVQTGADRPINYTANSVDVGRYEIRLWSNYVSNNASTAHKEVTHTMVWSDILYVEAGRITGTPNPIVIPKTILGTPNNPHRKDKVSANVTVSGSGTTTGASYSNVSGSSYPVNLYGEGLWIHGANWDGSSSNSSHRSSNTDGMFGATFGNEVLFITWDGLYNADYYELELLINNETYGRVDAGQTVQVDNISKFGTIPVGDTQWETFKTQNQAKLLEMKFTGEQGHANHYKTVIYKSSNRAMTEPINNGSYYRSHNGFKRIFSFMADRELARANGGLNKMLYNGGNYIPSTRSSNGSWISPADPATGLSRFNNNSYRVGLEGNCNALGILTHNMADGNWYAIRLRAVNEYGFSDWIYWKGGKN